MRYIEHGEERGRYEARLLDGPLAGVHVRVNGPPGGDPLDVLPIEGHAQGAYVLAGFESIRGYLPYRWVTREEWASLRRWLRRDKPGGPTP